MRMLPTRQLGFCGAAVLLAGTLVWLGPGVTAQVSIDDDDIGGVVRGAGGPEAGVWVIAETTDLDTLYRKIVVTDDAGRYVLPDLPDARYRVWVRGYGLTDSEPVTSTPGTALDLRAVQAASPRGRRDMAAGGTWRFPARAALTRGNISRFTHAVATTSAHHSGGPAQPAQHRRRRPRHAEFRLWGTLACRPLSAGFS